MKVNRNLTTHPKFIAYKRELGDPAALEYLIRLWGHCEEQQRGEDWGKVTAEYIEAICNWPGEREKLFTALTRPFCGKPGWISIKSGGKVIISNWNEQNIGLVANWLRNPGGKKKNGSPKGNPPETPRGSRGQAPGNPIREDLTGEEGSGKKARAHIDFPEVEIPSLEEVLDFCRRSKGTPQEVSEETGRAFWQHYEKTALPPWTDNGSKHFQWRGKLVTWARKDLESGGAKKSPADEKNRAQLEAELDIERDPAKRQALKDQLKKLGGA